MAYEKRLAAIPSTLFTANGTADGKVTVADSSEFVVKHEVFLTATGQPNLELEIKQIDDINTIYVGPRSGNIKTRTDLSAYTVAANAAIVANEQKRPSVPKEEIERAVYAEEPVVAYRVHQVDEFGHPFNTENPMSVRLSDGSINIGTLNAELEVQLSHKDNDPNAGDVHDSVRIGDGTREVVITAANELKVRDADANQTANDTLTEIQDFHADNTNENAAQLSETQSFHTNAVSQLTAINTELDIVTARLDSILAEEATEAKQDSQITLATSANALLTQIRDYVDTLETLIATSNVQLSAINTNTDGIEGLITSTNTKLDAANATLTAISGFTDGLEALITSTNTKLDTVNTNLGTVQNKQDTSNASLASLETRIGATNETAAVSDTATSGLNGLIKRVAQRLSSILTTQTDGTQKSRLLDGAGTAITSTLIGGKQRLDVNLASGGVPTSPIPTQTQLVGGRDASGNLQSNKVDANGSQFGVLTSANHPQFSAEVAPYNRLRVTTEATTLLVDKFDGAAFDPNMWATRVIGAGAVNTGTGNLSIVTGTTTSNAGILLSVPSFQHPGNAFLQFGMAVKYEATLTTNTKRFWGFCTEPTGGATYTTPIQEGVCFEVDALGALRASIYNAGVRVYSQVLTAKTDNMFHRHDIFYNTQNISWYIDGALQAHVTNGTNPSVQNLPAYFAMFNNTAAAPPSAPTLQSQAFAITDTASNHGQLSDGKYPWRKATVLPNNLLATAQPDEAVAFLGRAFRVTTGEVNLTTNNETALFYVVNASNSGKILKTLRVHLGSPGTNNSNMVYRFYLNPGNISTPGATLTPVGARQNNQLSSSISISKSSGISTSNFGNAFLFHRVYSGGADYVLDQRGGQWLEPGHRLLITAQSSSALGNATHVSMFFYEEPVFGG